VMTECVIAEFSLQALESNNKEGVGWQQK
jgi:hypothetical protein